ncbi:alcohol dehydrogenase catalytic domain-containing protein [Vibrio jasicida]|uniref:alcohol dehydrogenase catalytic domain-containing protein n=1 Tax=Vibrio jasicida TaxID=766224 RepID=UPI0036F37CF8
MKAITYQKDQDTFTYTDIDTPALASGLDVLVKVHAVGLNPVDAKVNLWHEMVDGMDDTFVGGLDVSGEILPSVTRCQIGRLVIAFSIMATCVE